MWTYEKKLQYPVNIKTPNPRLAKFIISQLGGPAASLRYMHQRYGMKNNQVKGILTDIATEELAHVEMVSAILYQLTRDMTPEQILQDGYAEYFVDHTAGIYPQGASGMPFTAAYFQSKGDPITDLTEDLAAEQKARSTYENILRLCDDPDVREPIKFLRQREIVHFQRFGEAMRMVQDELNAKLWKTAEMFQKIICCKKGTARAREGASGSSFFILSCKSLFAVVREQLTRNHAIVKLSPFGCWFAEEGFKVRIRRNHIAGILLVCWKDTAHNLIERFRSLYI